MPLLIEVLPSYPDIASGKTWDRIPKKIRLRLWQERCKSLLADSMKDADKALKDAQGRLKSFDVETKSNPPRSQPTAMVFDL